MVNIVTVKSPILLPLYERKCANYDDSFISSQFQLATEKKKHFIWKHLGVCTFCQKQVDR
jgi:hypothetical protein